MTAALSRMHRRCLIMCAFVLLPPDGTVSQVNLGTENLNGSLKEVQRIHVKLRDAPDDTRPELLFQLGTAADMLALRLNRQIAEYGNTHTGLIELIVRRSNELDVKIQWLPQKERFFYDGAAFSRYMQIAPDGPRAAESAYQLLELSFFKSSGDDLTSLLTLAKQKQDYLEHYADKSTAAKTRIMLAIEYRDISRIVRSEGDTEEARRFMDRALDQTRLVIAANPGTRVARTAEALLDRLESEFQTPGDTETKHIN